MTIPWEENPAYQKAQARIVLGVLGIATAVSVVFGILSGKWTPLLVIGGIWVGLVVVHLIIGAVFAGVLTVISTFTQRENGQAGETETQPEHLPRGDA